MLTPADGMLVLGCGAACYTDITTGKIPNGLTLPMCAAGLVLHAFAGQGWVFGLAGLVVAFVLHFGLWAAGVVKGGDAKLMMGVGAVVGGAELIETTLWELVLLLPIGLLTLVVLGRLGNFKKTLEYTVAKAQGDKEATPPEEQTMMVFGPVIAVAVLVARFTEWLAFL